MWDTRNVTERYLRREAHVEQRVGLVEHEHLAEEKVISREETEGLTGRGRQGWCCAFVRVCVFMYRHGNRATVGRRSVDRMGGRRAPTLGGASDVALWLRGTNELMGLKEPN